MTPRYEEDLLVLQEYDQWLTEKSNTVPPTLTVDLFLKEREDEHNRRRIADALEIIPEGTIYELGDGTISTLLESVRSILVDDRPYVIETSIAGPTARSFT